MTPREELIQVAAVAVAMVEDLDYGQADANAAPNYNLPMDTQARNVLADVFAERYAQDNKWGPQHHPLELWFTILMEEVGEAAQAYLNQEVFT